MNASNPGVRIILGGTCIHNCESFLAELGKMEGHSGRADASAADGAASAMAGLGFSPPSSKRIAALTSTATASLTSFANQGISKLA